MCARTARVVSAVRRVSHSCSIRLAAAGAVAGNKAAPSGCATCTAVGAGVSPAVVALCKLLFCNAIRLWLCLNFTLARQFSGSHYQSACIWHASDTRRQCWQRSTGGWCRTRTRSQVSNCCICTWLSNQIFVANSARPVDPGGGPNNPPCGSRGCRINSGSFSSHLLCKCI